MYDKNESIEWGIFQKIGLSYFSFLIVEEGKEITSRKNCWEKKQSKGKDNDILVFPA